MADPKDMQSKPAANESPSAEPAKRAAAPGAAAGGGSSGTSGTTDTTAGAGSAATGEPKPGSAAGGKPAAPAKPGARGERAGGNGRGVPLLALLLLLIATATAAGGYYLWQGQQALHARQSPLASRAALDEQARAAEAELTALRRQLQAQDEARRGDAGIRASVDQSLAQLRQAQAALEQRIGRLDAVTDAERAELLRAEAAYLANIARYRAAFFNDPDAALAALRQADRVLAALGGEAVRERQAVNRAIDALVKVSLPDIDALAGEVEALITRVDVLPLDLEVSRQQPDQPEAAAPAAGWQDRLGRAWQRLKQSLGTLVLVQRREQPLEPLLEPEERQFLRHNLRLRLESARLALLMAEPELYRRSLDRVGEWVQRYFATGEPAVDETLARLRELREQPITAPMPDLGPLLAPVTGQ